MSYHEITWKISYANMIMIGASIPVSKEDNKEVKDNGLVSGSQLASRFKR